MNKLPGAQKKLPVFTEAEDDLDTIEIRRSTKMDASVNLYNSMLGLQ